MSSERPDFDEKNVTLSYLNRIVELVSLVKQKVDNLEDRLNQTQPPKRKGFFNSFRPEICSPKGQSPSNNNTRIRFNPCFGYLRNRSTNCSARRIGRSKLCNCSHESPFSKPDKEPDKPSPVGDTNENQLSNQMPADNEKTPETLEPPAKRVESFFTELVQTKPMDPDEPSRDFSASGDVIDETKFMILNSVIHVPTKRGSLKVVTHSESCQCDLCKTVLTKKSHRTKLLDEHARLIQKKLIRIPTEKGYKTLVTHFENCRCSLCVKLNQGLSQIDDTLQIEHHDAVCPCGICQTVKSKHGMNGAVIPQSSVLQKILSNPFLSQSDRRLHRDRENAPEDFLKKYLNHFSVVSYSEKSYRSICPQKSLLGPLNDELKKYQRKRRAAFKIKNTRIFKTQKQKSMTKIRPERDNNVCSSRSDVNDVCSFHPKGGNNKRKVVVELRGSSKKNNVEDRNDANKQENSLVLTGELNGRYSSIFKPSERSLENCEKLNHFKEAVDPLENKGLLRALTRKKCGCPVCEK